LGDSSLGATFAAPDDFSSEAEGPDFSTIGQRLYPDGPSSTDIPGAKRRFSGSDESSDKPRSADTPKDQEPFLGGVGSSDSPWRLESPPHEDDEELTYTLMDDEIVSLFEPLFSFPESGVDLVAALNKYEDRMIRAALAATKGVKNHAAKALGLNRTTFLEKLKKKGIE
jgi:hypothetical protein